MKEAGRRGRQKRQTEEAKRGGQAERGTGRTRLFLFKLPTAAGSSSEACREKAQWGKEYPQSRTDSKHSGASTGCTVGQAQGAQWGQQASGGKSVDAMQ